MKLADINVMDKISDEFENGSDQTNSSRVTSPLIVKMAIIDLVNSVASLFFAGSSRNLQIIMTCIKSCTNLKMGQIGPTVAELCPLDCQDCL